MCFFLYSVVCYRFFWNTLCVLIQAYFRIPYLSVWNFFHRRIHHLKWKKKCLPFNFKVKTLSNKKHFHFKSSLNNCMETKLRKDFYNYRSLSNLNEIAYFRLKVFFLLQLYFICVFRCSLTCEKKLGNENCSWRDFFSTIEKHIW